MMMNIFRMPTNGFCRCEDIVVRHKRAEDDGTPGFPDVEAGAGGHHYDQVQPTSVTDAGKFFPGALPASAPAPVQKLLRPVEAPDSPLQVVAPPPLCPPPPDKAAENKEKEGRELQKKLSGDSLSPSSNASTSTVASTVPRGTPGTTTTTPSSRAFSSLASRSSASLDSAAAAAEKAAKEKAVLREMVKAFTRDAVQGVPCQMLMLEEEAAADHESSHQPYGLGLASAPWRPVEYAVDKGVKAFYIRKRHDPDELQSAILHWFPLNRLGGLFRWEDLKAQQQTTTTVTASCLTRAKNAITRWGGAPGASEEMEDLRHRLLIFVEDAAEGAGMAGSSALQVSFALLLEDVQARDRAFSALSVLRLCAQASRFVPQTV